MLETLPAGVAFIPAVGDSVGAGNQENDVVKFLRDDPRSAHEDVEAAHRLKAAADIGDHARLWRDFDTRKRARPALSDRRAKFFFVAVIDRAIDAVEYDEELIRIFIREFAVLKPRGCIPDLAILKV